MRVSELTWLGGCGVGSRCCERCSMSLGWPLHVFGWRCGSRIHYGRLPLEEVELVQSRGLQLLEYQP